MRKFSYLLLAGALFVGVSCATDLSEVYNRLDQLEQKVQNLERLNSTVNGLYTIVSSFEKNVYVETVTETQEGYVIKFTDGKTATIKNGDKGPKGDPGDPGAPGNPGTPGETPTIGVADENGQLVWTVNGNVIKDESGKSVPASVSVPEFKFDNNKWWYRFGATDSWKDCGEKTGPEPSIIETDEFVIISIGGNIIQIPKEVVSPAIKEINPVITISAKRIFVPVGASVDLRDFFEVEPEGALKTMVDYDYAEDAPFIIDEKGILSANAAGSFTVTISAKVNPEVSTQLIVRTAETPNDEIPERAINPDKKLVLFEGSLAEYNSLLDFGGSTSWNPFNNSIAGIVNGTLNTRFAVPVQEDATLTRENGHLHFMFYIDDIANVHPDNLELIELTNGTWDVQEIHWNNSIFSTLKSGWNEIDLAFKDATDELGTPFDPTKPSFFRVVVPASGPDGSWAAFQIKDFFVYAEEPETINPVITIDANRLFVPVGKSIDLKEWYEISPANAEVEYTFTETAPFTVSSDGILEATGEGSYTVNIVSKKNPDVKTSIVVRTAETPNDEIPERAINPDKKLVLFEGSLAEYNSLLDFGGSTSWNPFNNSIAGVVNGTLNTRFAVPVKEDATLTRENGHLHFMFYIDDIANVHPDNLELIELTNGTWDVQEIHWNNSIFSSLKSGWNEIDLAFKDATDELGTPFDPTKPSFFRVVVPASGPDGSWAAFQIKDFFVYAEEPETPVQITIDGDMSDWAKVSGFSSEQNSRIREWKFFSDENNVYIYAAMRKNRVDNGRKFVVGFNTDNDASTGSLTDNNNMKGCEALASSIKPFTNDSGASTLIAVTGLDSESLVSGVGAAEATAGVVKVFANAGDEDISADASNAYIELSIPKDKLNLPAGEISIACSYDYYWTGYQKVTL